MLNYAKLNNLFLRQSYLDSWGEYQRWLERGKRWDYIVLTASNEEQANGYRQEIAYRREQGYLAEDCEYIVLADPDGKRVGSGGATLNVLKYLALNYSEGTSRVLHGSRVLVIHSGGDSKRVPQYSVCGKLFSPVPRVLPDGRPSTLFDEFMISMAAVAARFEEGMLVLSGDVLLLFNPLQLDFQFKGAAAISMKEPVSIGKNHGVFLNDGNGYVKRFLHKQLEEQLEALGAVNNQGNVDLDTGAVLLDAQLLEALYGLISIDGVYDDDRFGQFVNDKARISFYGDFLYPLASDVTLEEYYKEAPEGSMCKELLECRTAIWEAISPFSMKLLSLSPAQFIHFGTTRELLNLMTEKMSDYSFLEWKSVVNSNVSEEVPYAVYNSVISEAAELGEACYLENSVIAAGAEIGSRSIISGTTVGAVAVPENVVIHGVVLKQGGYCNRIYGVLDNPKVVLEKGATWLGTKVSEVLAHYDISAEAVWGNEEHYLWFANLYPVCASASEAMNAALMVQKIFALEATKAQVEHWLASERMSLYSSFNEAAVEQVLPWNRHLQDVITVEKFLNVLRVKGNYREAVEPFTYKTMTEAQFRYLLGIAVEADFSLKIRIYNSLAKYMRENKLQMDGVSARELEERCFDTIQTSVCDAAMKHIRRDHAYHIQKDTANVELPVRVNWGGGWTDTPPYCNENGGIVLNAAIKLNSIYPVQVSIRRLEEYHVEFASEDIGVSAVFTDVAQILDCKNPYDHFALHKAAFIACGLVGEEDAGHSLEELLKRLGGGIYLSTKVVGIPKGSGLGTSSILAGACVKAIYEFLGEDIEEEGLYDIVLCMEQIMSTGGGWQDQVGGLCPGIKMITTRAGMEQHIQVEPLKVPEKAMKELQERFALIYTGQRRLARNLLRDVVGNYICGRPESVQALEEMQRVAVIMQYELQKGDIDRFAKLLNRHWELSLQLDGGATNTCIDQIFLACEDLIDGKFISGAGGGGFLQVILKKGVTKEQLNARLYQVFQDAGVSVWASEFV
ncbi:MAG: bifunctional fucokinase/L-fucose-1-P-guanylyltransferase [Lachnospiraceae bacterium]|nr:bifunctional fucokinase/L-fucose-1-P-guanylyltransferase [Lachnospiraceae bacterium]